MIDVLVVGYGLAGRSFHAPLIVRQSSLRLSAIATRDIGRQEQARTELGVPVFPSLNEAIERLPNLRLVVIATPHDSHVGLVETVLDAGKDCVVDKVMALTTSEADRMIAARDRSGRMLSVFQNRRWDWDYLTFRSVVESGEIGRVRLVDSSVCRYSPPRTWRGRAGEAGTILHDWGAHLVDQALQAGFGPCRRLHAWITPAPWPGVDTGGHGRIVLEFDEVTFTVETSRISPLERPRWWVIGTEGGFERIGIDPQEDALRSGRFDRVEDFGESRTIVQTIRDGKASTRTIAPTRGSWDSFYANIAAHLEGRADLEVTAEQGREVVRVLEAAGLSSDNHIAVEGPWGFPA